MALTQMMQQYFSIKEKYNDCIIFYRLGDFYEMFFDDAVKVSKLLDLTLTGRDCGLKNRAPMCGVPYHASESYIAKLVSLGEKVAICEQLEDPATAQGMVARGVVRIVTAGTVINDAYLDEKVNNFISCVYKCEDAVAVAWADITTGKLSTTEFSGKSSVRQAILQLVKLNVKEVVCNDEMIYSSRSEPEITTNILPQFSSYPTWAFSYASAERTILEQFNVKTLSAYSIADRKNVIGVVGALLEYLKDTQMHALKNIDNIEYLLAEHYLQLDDAAIKNLELVKSLGTGKKYGSLLWLLDKTSTSMGARLLSNSILTPFGSIDEINFRLNGVEELFNSTVVRLNLINILQGMNDIERLSGKISNNNILPKDCLALSHSISIIPNIKFALTGFTSTIINNIRNELVDLTEISDLINSAICDNPPPMMKDGGYIKQGYSKQLDELRDMKEKATQKIKQIEERERDNSSIKTLKIGFNRVFGYYIEVSKSFKDKVPLHYQRKQTLANAERYTTDELKDLESRILGSEDESLKLEARLFEFIKSVLTDNIKKFKTISLAIAQLDLILNFAELAKKNKYVRPQIVDSCKQLIIKDGRHPVVESISKDKFIPNDTILDENENRTMIITGPNMAGKSTFMRQTAIITIMAHLGCFVPAKSAQIPLVDKVYTRVGASDNLISDQSTFMVEMIEVATILRNATKHSLLILDEVGRGTSTYDGLSIAWAVIEHLTQNIGAKTMFATHYHELTELENIIVGIKNYKISVKEINNSIVFLRKIMRGGANRSFGIEVASLAGVPDSVTSRAKSILKSIENGDKKFNLELEDSNKEKSDSISNNEINDKKSLTEVETILSEVNLNQMSPMQAFMLLSDLVEKVKKWEE